MYDFQFEAEVCKYDFGKYYYTIVWLPPELVPKLPLNKYPRLRVEARVNEAVILDAALMPDGGSWYLMVNKKVLAKIGKNLGDVVSVQFSVVDQNLVYIPPTLQNLIDKDPDFAKAWNKWTAGKQRGYAYTVGKAKSQPIIEKRLLEIYEAIVG